MFRCSGCGLCCKNVKRAVEVTKHIKELEFPYNWDETGRCEKLMEDNKCGVYDDRPLLCNVDGVIKFFNLDKESFYGDNEKACIELQAEDENN